MIAAHSWVDATFNSPRSGAAKPVLCNREFPVKLARGVGKPAVVKAQGKDRNDYNKGDNEHVRYGTGTGSERRDPRGSCQTFRLGDVRYYLDVLGSRTFAGMSLAQLCALDAGAVCLPRE
jgi:hypothetical protein